MRPRQAKCFLCDKTGVPLIRYVIWQRQSEMDPREPRTLWYCIQCNRLARRLGERQREKLSELEA